MNIICVVNYTTRSSETDINHDSLLFASIILLDVNRIIGCIYALITIILRYMTAGISITDNVIEVFLHESTQLKKQ